MLKEKMAYDTEDFYKNLLTICPEGLIVADEDGTILFASKKIYELHKVPSEEVITGKSIFDYISPECKKAALKNISKMFREEKSKRNDYVLMRYDGTKFNAEITATPIIDENRRISGFFSVTRDITDNVRYNDELFIKENMLDSAINGMALSRFRGGITYVNKAALKMWGYDNEEEVFGRNPGDFWDQSNNIEDFRNELISKDSLVKEVKAVRKNGSFFDVQMAASIIRDDKGEPIYVMGSFLDISERKKNEENIINSLKEKELLFKEIHHRVKNNLQIVSSLISLQMQNVNDDLAENILLDCQNRIHSMAKLHESLYQSESLLYINFHEYVRNIVMHLLISFNAVDKIALDLDVDNIKLGMDKAIPCGLIINEILSNSIKHGFDMKGKKEKQIHVTMKHVSGRKIRLVISDNGSGISGEFLNKKKSLGMKLIFALIEQIDGKVTVDSQSGTEFDIYFEGDDY